MELMRRSLAEIRYSSFFPPEDISARGMETIPNNYYRDDGLKLWNIIYRLTFIRYNACLGKVELSLFNVLIIENFTYNWFTFTSFVKAMVNYYYSSDSDVKKDTELQEWIGEIFTHALLQNKESGIITTTILIVILETRYVYYVDNSK